MIVNKRDGDRVEVSMDNAEYLEVQAALRYVRERRSHAKATANKAVRNIPKSDYIIRLVIQTNDFLNKLLERHKQHAWNKAYQQAQEDDR